MFRSKLVTVSSRWLVVEVAIPALSMVSVRAAVRRLFLQQESISVDS